MKEQPEALRLAAELDAEIQRTVQLDMMHHNAAAELRRLHAIVAAREDDIETHSAAVYEATRLLAQAREQRDALLEACQTLVGLPGTEDWQETLRKAVQQARAAIAKAEEA